MLLENHLDRKLPSIDEHDALLDGDVDILEMLRFS